VEELSCGLLRETGKIPESSFEIRGTEADSFALRSPQTPRRTSKDSASAYAEAEDDSARDLKIVERLAAGHYAARNAGYIAECSFVVADLVSSVESEGEPLREEILQATAEVSSEGRLAAVGACVHEVGVQLGGLIVVAECNFVPRATRTRRDVWHPFPSDCGEVVDIVGRESKRIGDSELGRAMSVEVVAHATTNRRPCLNVQSKTITLMVDGSRSPSKKRNLRASGLRSERRRSLSVENVASESSQKNDER